MTTEEENKALVRRLVEAVINGGDMAAFDELVAADYADLAEGEQPVGREEYGELIAATRAALPDLRMTIEGEVAEGDTVAIRFRASATHSGEFLGVPATGAPGVGRNGLAADPRRADSRAPQRHRRPRPARAAQIEGAPSPGPFRSWPVRLGRRTILAGDLRAGPRVVCFDRARLGQHLFQFPRRDHDRARGVGEHVLARDHADATQDHGYVGLKRRYLASTPSSRLAGAVGGEVIRPPVRRSPAGDRR